MPLLNPPKPEIPKRKHCVKIEEPLAMTMEKYAEFIETDSIDHVIMQVQALDRYYCPWPADDLMLRLIAVRAPVVYTGICYTYTLLLFTTPYIVYSILLSGFYVLAWKPTKKIEERELPPYPDPRECDKLPLVLGEVHDPRKPAPCANPYWLEIPERGLFTGIGIFGAIGASKTTGCMLPYTEQLIASKAAAPDRCIGGLVFEVTLAYNGFNPLPPKLMYLRPCFLDVNKSYFRQLEEGELSGGLASK